MDYRTLADQVANLSKTELRQFCHSLSAKLYHQGDDDLLRLIFGELAVGLANAEDEEDESSSSEAAGCFNDDEEEEESSSSSSSSLEHPILP